MSDEGIKTYTDADDKTKLGVLRSELRRRIVTIQGFSSALKTQWSHDSDENLTVMSYVDRILEAVNDMDEIIEILTG